MKSSKAAPPREIPRPPVLRDGESVEDEILTYVMRAAARAPSWYNCQPWQFVAVNDGIDVYLDVQADTSLFDWHNINSMLACGAALENIQIAAEGRGLVVSISEFPDKSQPLLIAHVELSRMRYPEEALGRNRQELETSIWRRHTNTLMFDDIPLDDCVLESLKVAIEGFPQISLHMAHTMAEKQRVFAAVSTAEQVRFARKDLHEQLHRMIRWSDSEVEHNPTGYTLASMGACGIGEAFFRVTRPWAVMRLMNLFGAFRDQAKRASLGLLNCSAIGLLTVNDFARQEIIASGRVLEKIWLAVTDQGLDLQPHSTINLFHWIWQHGGRDLFSRSQQTILARAFQLYGDAFPGAALDAGTSHGVFLFRIGRGRAVRGFTPRRDAESKSTKQRRMQQVRR